MNCFRPSFLFALILFLPAVAFGDSREALITGIDDRYEQNKEIALSIWELAELGYLEVQSTALLQDTLSTEGFRVERLPMSYPTTHRSIIMSATLRLKH